MAERSRVARAPDGSEYEIVVQRAPRLGGFRSDLTRLWNTLRRDESWWITVAGDRWPWPLLRERFESEFGAELRADSLERSITAGEIQFTGPAWRRRWGASR